MSTKIIHPSERRPMIPAEFLDGTVLHRSSGPIDVADDEGVLEGILAPYGQESEVAPGLFETFAPGAFAAAVRAPARVKLKEVGHGDAIIGHALALEDRPDGLWGRIKIVRETAKGAEAEALLRAGSVDELSVEFVPMRKSMTVERRGTDEVAILHGRARLLGVSPVGMGAHAGAKVLALREDGAASESKRREQILAELRGLTH